MLIICISFYLVLKILEKEIRGEEYVLEQCRPCLLWVCKVVVVLRNCTYEDGVSNSRCFFGKVTIKVKPENSREWCILCE